MELENHMPGIRIESHGDKWRMVIERPSENVTLTPDQIAVLEHVFALGETSDIEVMLIAGFGGRGKICEVLMAARNALSGTVPEDMWNRFQNLARRS